MSSYGYDILPRSANNARRKLIYWVVLAVLGFFVLVNVLVVRTMRPSPGLLDEYQPLKTVDEGLLPHYLEAGGNATSNVFEIPVPEERAVVSTLYSDSYLTAVLTLGYSLKTAQITARRILLYFPGSVSSEGRTLCQLKAAGWELHPIERVAPPDGGRDVYYRFVDNYSKLQMWTLDKIGIKSVVYLDADTLVRRNFDELWTLPFTFAAVPDVYGDKRGFALTFNAGMMFLRTSTDLFNDMVSKIESYQYQHGEAEQGLMNMYFAAQVVLLPYIYNANLMIKQRNPVLWQALEKDTRIVHYTILKPFIDDERRQAKSGIWEPEMRMWEAVWRDMFTRELMDKC